MHTIDRNRRGHLQWRTLALVTSGMVALSVLGTGSVLAGKPNLIVTGDALAGTPGDTATTAQPTTVSTSETIRFTTSIKNVDTSNVSQLYFTTSSLPPGATVTQISSAERPTACSTTSTPLCSFGALRPGQSVGITITFTSPATVDPTIPACVVGSYGHQGATTTLSGSGPYFCVDLRWYANGFPTSDGGTSHGDFFSWNDGASLSGDAINFRGRFVYLNGQKVVGNSLNVSNSNKQGTQASVNDLDIPVTVLDGPGVPKICTTTLTLDNGQTFDCTKLSSETSDVNVAQGDTVLLFTILVKFNQAPNGLKGNSPVALHQYVTPGGATVNEAITTKCQFTAGVPNSIPCLVVGSGAKSVIIWNTHNGKFQF